MTRELYGCSQDFLREGYAVVCGHEYKNINFFPLKSFPYIYSGDSRITFRSLRKLYKFRRSQRNIQPFAVCKIDIKASRPMKTGRMRELIM